jgi:antitoxin MazE
MVTKVSKWGNSLGLRLPKALAEELGIEEGTAVDLTASKGNLVVRPLVEGRYELEELLSEVREENLHGEVETGPARGRESW